MEDILDKIVARTRLDHSAQWEAWDRQETSQASKQPRTESSIPTTPPRRSPQPVRPLIGNIGNDFFLIAECKQASPSKGILRAPYDPAAIAEGYVNGGAGAISVLTEPHFFQGSLEHLKAVRAQVEVPLLCKDFFLHPKQIHDAVEHGADIILLIQRILDPAAMKRLLLTCREVGATALIEIFSRAEGEQALAIVEQLRLSEHVLLGINNRNLQDFAVQFDHTFEVMAALQTTIPIIGESGVRHAADIAKLAEGGCKGALVGEALLRANDVEAATRTLLAKSPA